MANGKPNRPIRPRGGGPKGRRRVVIDQGGARAMAADIHAQNIALIAQKSPAVAGQPILHEALRVVHDASPSRLPNGLMVEAALAAIIAHS